MLLKTVFVVACIIGALVVVEARQQDQWRLRPQNKINREPEEENLEEEGSIRVAEPYKTLIQLTTRQALTQANIGKHVDVDTAMSVINEVFYMLSKPANLMKVVEAMVAVAAASIGIGLLFPGAQKQLEMVWKEPGKTLHHLSSGLSEKSIHQLLEMSTDKLLSGLGMKEEACKLQSICYIGEQLHSKLPSLPKVARKFIIKHKLGQSLKGNKYVAAFSAGHGHKCEVFDARASDKNCLVDMMEHSLNHMHQLLAKFIT